MAKRRFCSSTAPSIPVPLKSIRSHTTASDGGSEAPVARQVQLVYMVKVSRSWWSSATFRPSGNRPAISAQVRIPE